VNQSMAELKHRRFVLIVDDGTIHKNLFASTLVEQFRKRSIALTLVSAKDGAQASLKAVNQKFDAIILDTSVPRMVESGFATNFRSVKNTRDGHLYVVSEVKPEDLPDSLKTGRLFSKPFQAQELVDALMQDLSGNEPEEEVSKYAVDVRVINAIISSTVKVLGQFQVKEIKMGKPVMKDPQDPMGGVISSVLSIVSQNFQGQLSISFDKSSFLELVTNMLCEEQTDITPDNQDAVGEINNIIYGNAKPDLAQFGVAMSIPKVIYGANQCLVCPVGSAAMSVPFQTSKGVFYIDVVAHPMPS
jgi:CheY-specific phosphatase CheX